MIAGSTLVTVSLAGSLFFSISPDEARSKILLYLLITMAPFAVVAPLLGPLLDRGRGSRRAMVVLAAAGSAVVCPFMASDLKGLLLFPEAFAILVLSKLYMVAKSSIVPSVMVDGDLLASANARLALLASLAGLTASIPAVVVLKLLGAAWVLRLDFFVFAAACVFALRLSRTAHGLQRASSPKTAMDSSSTSSVHNSAASTGSQDYSGWDELAGQQDASELLGGRFLPPAASEALLAATAISVLRGAVGFLTLMLAFALRRDHAALWWYGLALATSSAGSMLGSLVVPRLRRILAEQQILLIAMGLVVALAVAAAAVGDLIIQPALTLGMGLAFSTAKPSFDALVQKHIPQGAQGRAFARFETRFQLVWVLGALIPVALVIPLVAGDISIAAVVAVSGVSYLTGRRAIKHYRRSA